MLLNGTSLRTLNVAFSTAFQAGTTEVTPTWNRVAMPVTSTTRENEYAWLGKMPRIREWLGDRVVQNLTSDGYRIRNRSFEFTVGVDRDDIDDDNLGIYTPLFVEMGRVATSFPDELVWPLLKSGFVTLCYDGQNFFDADHPVLDEAGRTVSVSNTQGGTGEPWFLIDTSRSMKPIIWQDRRAFAMVNKDRADDDNVFFRKELLYGMDGRCNAGFGLWQLAYASRQPLTAANYAAARVAMQSQRGDRGRPLQINPRLLVVPPGLEPAAREVLQAERNAVGATNVWRGTAELHVEPWLA